MGTIFIPVWELRPRGVKQLVQGGTASVVEARLEPQSSVRGWSGGYEDPSIQDMFVVHLLLPGPVLDAGGSDPHGYLNPGGITSSWLLPGCCIVPRDHQVAPAHSGAGLSLPTSLVCRGSLCGGSCPRRCRSYSSISGFHSVGVSSMCPSPQGDNLNRLQTLPSIPWREKLLQNSQRRSLGPCSTAFIYCVSSGLDSKPRGPTAGRDHAQTELAPRCGLSIQGSGTPRVKFMPRPLHGGEEPWVQSRFCQLLAV